MTRINVGVHPRDLTDKHLLAEHREIKRIPNMVKSGKAKIENIPDQFTLGKGHVKFFYNKLGFLLRRYNHLYDECIKRGFAVTAYHEAWDNIPKELMGNYIPSKLDRKIILERINQRLQGVK
jgi:hypothetical protein